MINTYWSTTQNINCNIFPKPHEYYGEFINNFTSYHDTILKVKKSSNFIRSENVKCLMSEKLLIIHIIHNKYCPDNVSSFTHSSAHTCSKMTISQRSAPDFSVAKKVFLSIQVWVAVLLVQKIHETQFLNSFAVSPASSSVGSCTD